MRRCALWILLPALLLPLNAAQRGKAKAKAPTASQLQAQVKKLSSERDELKERVASLEGLQQELACQKKVNPTKLPNV